MATNSNPKIQALMNEVESLTDVNNLEDKLNEIARLVAAEQQKAKQAISGVSHKELIDPADAFACEGCQ